MAEQYHGDYRQIAGWQHDMARHLRGICRTGGVTGNEQGLYSLFTGQHGICRAFTRLKNLDRNWPQAQLHAYRLQSAHVGIKQR